MAGLASWLLLFGADGVYALTIETRTQDEAFYFHSFLFLISASSALPAPLAPPCGKRPNRTQRRPRTEALASAATDLVKANRQKRAAEHETRSERQKQIDDVEILQTSDDRIAQRRDEEAVTGWPPAGRFSVGHQTRYRHVVHQRFGDAAKHPLPCAGVAIGAGHDQIGAEVVCPR